MSWQVSLVGAESHLIEYKNKDQGGLILFPDGSGVEEWTLMRGAKEQPNWGDEKPERIRVKMF